MSSVASNMVDPSGPNRKLAEYPTPFSRGQWDHEIIPKMHNNCTLVLCFNGTGNEFDADVHKPIINFYPPTTTIPLITA